MTTEGKEGATDLAAAIAKGKSTWQDVPALMNRMRLVIRDGETIAAVPGTPAKSDPASEARRP